MLVAADAMPRRDVWEPADKRRRVSAARTLINVRGSCAVMVEFRFNRGMEVMHDCKMGERFKEAIGKC